MNSGCKSERHRGGTHSGAHWGTVNCTYNQHRQPAGEPDKEGTDNQTDRGHTQWQHSTVHTEDTGNQPGVGEVGHRGYREPDRQGHTGALPNVHTILTHP